jgi:hypothetical protein
MDIHSPNIICAMCIVMYSDYVLIRVTNLKNMTINH